MFFSNCTELFLSFTQAKRRTHELKMKWCAVFSSLSAVFHKETHHDLLWLWAVWREPFYRHCQSWKHIKLSGLCWKHCHDEASWIFIVSPKGIIPFCLNFPSPCYMMCFCSHLREVFMFHWRGWKRGEAKCIVCGDGSCDLPFQDKIRPSCFCPCFYFRKSLGSATAESEDSHDNQHDNVTAKTV